MSTSHGNLKAGKTDQEHSEFVSSKGRKILLGHKEEGIRKKKILLRARTPGDAKASDNFDFQSKGDIFDGHWTPSLDEEEEPEEIDSNIDARHANVHRKLLIGREHSEPRVKREPRGANVLIRKRDIPHGGKYFDDEDDEDDEEGEGQEGKEEEEKEEEEEKGDNLKRVRIVGKKPSFLQTLKNDAFLAKLMEDCAMWDSEFPFSSKALNRATRRRVLKKMKNSITVIEGTIGAGKTYFCNKLKREFKKEGYPCIVLEEYVNKELLNWFLEDEINNAFEFQLIMLFQRIKTYARALKLKKNGYTVIIDRSLHGDMAFELMHYVRKSISKQQHEIYLNFIKKNSQCLDTPDFCILLDVTTDTARFNIGKRGRDGELAVYTHEYLSNLKDSYEFCLSKFSIPVLRVNYDGDGRRTTAFPVNDTYDEDGKVVDTFDYDFMYVILEDLISTNAL